jgi:DNA replication protein DnaC
VCRDGHWLVLPSDHPRYVIGDNEMVPCPRCGWKATLGAAHIPFLAPAPEGEVPDFEEPFDASNVADLTGLQIVMVYAAQARQRALAGEGLLLWGNSGGGKSRLAAQVALAGVVAGLKVRFGALGELLDGLKASFDAKDGSGDVLWQSWTVGCDLLVLDDLGAENMTDWAQDRAFQLIDTRLKRKRAILATTNYAIDELARALSPRNAVMGMRLASRLTEMCPPIEIRAKRDYRLVRAQRRLASV